MRSPFYSLSINKLIVIVESVDPVEKSTKAPRILDRYLLKICGKVALVSLILSTSYFNFFLIFWISS